MIINFIIDQFELIFGSSSRTQSTGIFDANSDSTRVCGECKKRFSKYSNLRIHVKKFQEGNFISVIYNYTPCNQNTRKYRAINNYLDQKRR
jgi:hypothetical protein